jgi:dTDP-4-dehydrorhamnose reductase
MFKRSRWFVVGAAAGASGTIAAQRRVRRAVRRIAPDSVVRTTAATARERAAHVADAVRDGRRTMLAKEAELRALADGRTPGAPAPSRDVIDISTERASRRR